MTEMKSWLDRLTSKFLHSPKKQSSIPEGVWYKCPDCKQTVYTKDLIKSLLVCPTCNYHLPLTPTDRIQMLLDENSFKPMFENIKTKDPIGFVDKKSYRDRIKQAMNITGANEAVITGTGKLSEQQVALAVLDFGYIGGSMGSVVGEKITRLIELACKEELPLITVSASGGARMQEGTLSLMQMAKTSISLNILKDKGLPFISVLTNPTLGGVSASFAMLGDIVVAEPKALIGFAGPRVIQQILKEDLPNGFQLSEYQLQHGGVDRIIERKNLKEEISLMLDYMLTAR